MEQKQAIRYLALSQEELIDAGAFDLQMSIAALEKGLLDFEKGKILFPDKIVQIFCGHILFEKIGAKFHQAFHSQTLLIVFHCNDYFFIRH